MAKMRSPNYPALSLGDSIQRVKLLWSKEKKTAVPADVAAKAIGYGGLNGPSRTALGALKKYGLVDSDDSAIRVSDLALSILHPGSEEERLTSTRIAAVMPELFSSLFTTHAHASDDAIKSYLITKLGFSESGARQVIKTFRDTIELAKLNETDHIPHTVSSQEACIQDTKNTALATRMPFNSERQTVPTEVFFGNSPEPIPYKTFSWHLAPGVEAQVIITGDEPKKEYWDAICKYAELSGSLSPSFKEGDTVEYVDAYTGDVKYGRIEKMYGSDAIIHTITKEEAGPNPKKFTPKADPRIAAITDGTGAIKK
jgi:hypothetical protein